MVSTRGRYALRTMIDIARYAKEGYVTLKDISKREEISIKYLEQVVSALVKANLLTGLRGSKGGYRLSRDLNSYTVLEILEVTEGTMAPVQCLKDEHNNCKRCGLCTTVEFWQGFDKAITDYLKGVTLLDLVNNAESKMYTDYSI